MSEEQHYPEFDRLHPQAIDAKVGKLYRYQSILPAQVKDAPALEQIAIDRLEQFLVDQWLFHPAPSQMNDPFEARPHFRWPDTSEHARELRLHLERLLKDGGVPFKDRKAEVGRLMANAPALEGYLRKAIHKACEETRLSCFTTLGNDILFWSHYADSHRGVCFEFDATKPPIGLAYKVRYDEAYPTAHIPDRTDTDSLRSLLTKSPDWAKEKEYRSLLVKDVSAKFVKLDQSGCRLHLPADVLTGVYFGARTPESDKELILRLLDKGPFTPKVYHGELSPDSFKVVFRPH